MAIKMCYEGNAKTYIELTGHKQYLAILENLREKTKYIQIVHVPGINHSEDKIISAAKELMYVLEHDKKVKRWAGTLSGDCHEYYEFIANDKFFDFLEQFESFYTDDIIWDQKYGFGLDDICFCDDEWRTLFYTTTHEHDACYDKDLLDLNLIRVKGEQRVKTVKIKGEYSIALIYTDIVDETALSQLKELCDQPFTGGSKIRVMPDVHAGKGCVIGFTAYLGALVIPNIVGVDIGCGMLTVELGKEQIDFEKLDEIIKQNVPSGMNVHDEKIESFPNLTTMHCYDKLKDDGYIERSIGTLGGGNHFIEIDVDDENNKCLVIHTGSRNLGKQVAEYYQNLAYDYLRGADKRYEKQKALVSEYKKQGRESEIQAAIAELKNKLNNAVTDVPKDLAYLTGEYRQMYLDDMAICQEFAQLNRYTIAQTIINRLFGKNLNDLKRFETVHNYIDLNDNIVRKGAVSAKKNEMLLIPINMRDGSLICIGKGNEEWNCSAPHGAGRLMSRSEAREDLSLDEYKSEMNGVYSSCICDATLDESPMAYKDIDDITSRITPTVEIIKQIKPIYNFKDTNANNSFNGKHN